MMSSSSSANKAAQDSAALANTKDAADREDDISPLTRRSSISSRQTTLDLVDIEDINAIHDDNASNSIVTVDAPVIIVDSHAIRDDNDSSFMSDVSVSIHDNNIGSDCKDDEADAWGFGRSSPSQNAARMPVDRDSEVYNMRHRRRGVAFVFNHMHFDPRLGLNPRNGTHADRDNLVHTLTSLGFDVRAHDDLTAHALDRLLEDCALHEDHADADCVVVAVMSHGELGVLYAADHAYKPDRLWSHFSADKCPTLAGKPKLFFVQACQGDQLDTGVSLKRYTETDSRSMSYKIPSRADFLVAYSTVPGFYSWRNTSVGSWFVQALCAVLRREAAEMDLLSMMTRVARTVALDFQSNTPGDRGMHEMKQIPCVTSMLTRDVYFCRR